MLPLNKSQIDKIAQLNKTVQRITASNEEKLDVTTEIILIVLSPNHPELTKEQIDDMVDLDQATSIMQSVDRAIHIFSKNQAN